VPSGSTFLSVARAVADALPDEAVIVGLEVSVDSSYVTVWTTTPRQVIGKGGRGAETIRDVIVEVVGHPVNLKVELADGELEGDSGITDRLGRTTMTVATTDIDPVPRPRIPRP
jgi:predicted RNA-binding protein YlqC (UPF0109 family)